MNPRVILTIVRKDLLVVARNKGVWMPIVLVPIIFIGLLPAVGILVPLSIGTTAEELEDVRSFLEHLPPGLSRQLAGLTEEQTWVVLFSTYFLAPFFLIIPIMISSVIGADSFAGEKERKTLEALLYTPASDAELFVGKVLTALIPAVLVSWLSFVVYGITVNLAGWSVMGRIFFPNTMWIALILWVVPAAAGLGLSVIVLVSSKVKGFQEANQIGGTVVIPIILLVVGQLTGVLYFSLPIVLLIGAILWGVDALLIRFGIRTFARGELMARL